MTGYIDATDLSTEVKQLFAEGTRHMLDYILCNKDGARGIHHTLFPFVLVDPKFLHSDWLTGVVHETIIL